MDLPHVVTLSELGVTHDPGTEWHPTEKANAFVDGLLPDLNEQELAEHLAKPEVYPDSGEPMSAEDSKWSPEGEV